MKDNHCALINLMGVCTEENESCFYFDATAAPIGVTAYYPSCIYCIKGKCCHAVAICTSTMKDNRSQRELKHLLNGGGI